MKITDISIQARNPDRVNVSVDGKYRFSLDVFQVGELGIKNGMEVTDEQIALWEEESAFGKLYARALEYTMMRPHSAKEVRDYLWRKTLTRRVRVSRKSVERGAWSVGATQSDKILNSKFQIPNSASDNDHEVVERPGVSQDIANRVYDRLVDRGYINDEAFTRYWLENRSQAKGASQRKLVNELRGKGVEQGIIDGLLPSSSRSDDEEIDKIIAKKRARYDDQKLLQYLMRQGFDYELIRSKLIEFPDQENEKD